MQTIVALPASAGICSGIGIELHLLLVMANGLRDFKVEMLQMNDYSDFWTGKDTGADCYYMVIHWIWCETMLKKKAYDVKRYPIDQ